jgi:hypothetical protein
MSFGNQSSTLPLRQYKRTTAFTLTIGIHLFLFVLWQSQFARQNADRQSTSDPGILWLLNPQANTVQEPTNTEEELPVQAASLQRPPKKPSVVSSTDTVTTLDPSVASPAPYTQVTPLKAPIEPEAPQAMPLNLSLPSSASMPRRSGNPAVELQLGRSRPRTLETLIGAALSSSNWTEERIDNDRVRFRSGNKCIDFQRPRGQLLDPFRSHGATPWISAGVKPC